MSLGSLRSLAAFSLRRAAIASTPGGAVATTVHMGPYHQMKPAHAAIYQWVRENGRRLATIVGSLQALERRSHDVSNGYLLPAFVSRGDHPAARLEDCELAKPDKNDAAYKCQSGKPKERAGIATGPLL